MKKILSLLFLSLFLLPLVSVNSLGIPNKNVDFVFLNTGSIDEYGNRILNVTVDQNDGGSWVERGIITFNNYTGSELITGLYDQEVKFTTVSTINYSWLDSNYNIIDGKSSMFITVGGVFTNNKMTLESYTLINKTFGWILTHSYIWDSPSIASYGIEFNLYGSGTSKNYNLTYYDADFSQSSSYHNDMTNDSWVTYSYRCNYTSSSDGTLVMHTNDTTAGFGIEDNTFAIDVSVYNFIEVKVKELSASFGWRFQVKCANGTWVYPMYYTVSTSIVRINIYEFTKNQDITHCRFTTTTTVEGDYMIIDYVRVYKFVNYDVYAQNGDRKSLTYRENSNLYVNFTFDQVDNELMRWRYTPNIEPSTTLKIASYVSSPLVRWSLIIDYDTEPNQQEIIPYYSSFTEYEIDLELDTIVDIYIYFDDVNDSLNSGSYLGGMRLIYIEQYGSYNKTLDNSGTFGTYDNDIDTLTVGFCNYDDGEYASLTGFKPLHELGNLTVASWVSFKEVTSYRIFSFVSQYASSNNRVCLGFVTDGLGDGYFNFTVGNGSHSVSALVLVEDLETDGYYSLVGTWDKNSYVWLSVNGVFNKSSSVLNGVTKCDNELSIGNEYTQTVCYIYGVSLYYYTLSNKSISLLHSQGKTQVFDYYHHYSFMEEIQGYGDTQLHDSDYSNAKRITWTLGLISTDLSGYLFPWPITHQTEWIWLIACMCLCIVPTLLLVYGKYKSEKTGSRFELLFWGILALSAFMVFFMIIITGAS